MGVAAERLAWADRPAGSSRFPLAGRPFLGVDEMHRYQTRYAAATATILTLRLNRQGYGVGQTGFAEKCLGLSLDRNGAHRSHAGHATQRWDGPAKRAICRRSLRP